MIKYTLTHSLFPDKSYNLHEGRGPDFGIDRKQAIIYINSPTYNEFAILYPIRSIYIESGGINPIFVKVKPWEGFVEIKKGDKIQILDGSYISLYRNQNKEFQIYSLKSSYYQPPLIHNIQFNKSLSSSSLSSISDEEITLKTEPIKRKKIIMDESEDDDENDYSKIQHKHSPNSIIYDLTNDNNNSGLRSITVKEDDDNNNSGLISKTRTLKDILNSCEKISNEIKSFVNKDLTDVIERSKLNELFSPFQLKNHQIIGVSWLYLFYCRKYNSVLADEMGLGKTIQTIGLLKYLYKVGNVKGPHLIVVPTSTLENWQREFNKWFKEFRVLKYHGTVTDKQEFRMKYNTSDKFDVLLITYSMFEKSQGSIDRQYLRKFHYKYMILDEAHFIRNADAKRYNRLCKINVDHKLLLTGTPFQNKLEELLNLLCFILPPSIIRRDEISDLCGECDDETVNTIKQIISPFILRRLKEEVLNDLVPKTLEILYIDMLEGQSALYNKIIENYKLNKESNLKNGSNLFVDLRKVSNHPLLLRNWYDENICKKLAPIIYQSGYYGNECNYNKVYPELLKSSDFEIYEICKEYVDVVPELSRYIYKDDLILKSAKFQKLKVLLPQLIKDGHKILIFSQWTKILDLIELLLNILNIHFLRIDGTVGVDDRQNIIDNYQNDVDIKVMLLSSRACGIGINCTCADTVILHDVDFNPQVDIQAEDRCHRIGQDKPVTIYHLVCKDSVDELIKKKAIEKRKLEKSIFSNEENDDNKIIEEMLKTVMLK